ncbi:type II secretion system protein N [Variovorax sp. LT1R16]|uniref:type II secretion system protein N n=1 Tax=Variovorax sp. LT1R16 TaxID=3443728 RepID=UPI003F45E55E
MTLPGSSHGARPTRRLWPWATAGALCGALATLGLQLPARWLTPAVERATGERLRLADVRGTLWNGSAVLSLAAGPGSHGLRALPGRTHWRLRPAMPERPDLAAGFRLAIDQSCCLDRPAQARIAIGPGGADLRLAALDWHGPVEVVQGLGTPWNTLGFEGRLRVSTQALHLRRQHGRMQLDGRLSLTAESVSSRISALRPLGSYRFELDGDATPGARKGPLRFTLATLQGPLQLRGQGAWTAGQLRFRGEAQAEAGREDALAHVLNLIGNRHGAIALRVLR